MDLLLEDSVKEELFENIEEDSRYLEKFKDMIHLAKEKMDMEDI